MAVIEQIKSHYFKKVKRGDKLVFVNEQEENYYNGLVAEIWEGTEVWESVKEKRPTRSEAQNNYYWLYLSDMEKQLGNQYTKEQLHDIFKKLFLTGAEYTYVSKSGLMFNDIIFPTTTTLTVKEFMEYIRNIEVESGVLAPDTSLAGLDYYVSKYL